jgi:hypothetical protein
MLSRLKLNLWHATQPAPEFAAAHSGPDHKALAYLVPRKFESLEVWLLMFCGVYGLLVAAVVLHGARETMLACVGLICMAVWRRYHPARNQTQWAVGALVVLAMVSLIYIDPSAGGSIGPFMFLLIVIALCYPLLMDTHIVIAFTMVLLALYYATGWRKTGAVSHELFVLRGIMLMCMCALSGRFGLVLRRYELRVDALRHDVASMAYNEHGLARYGARLLHTCAAEMQPCTLVLMPLPKDWHDVMDVSGRGSDYSATQSHRLQTRALRDMALHLTLALPNESVVSRNAQGDWVALVPWLDQQSVLNVLESHFGRPLQLPFGPRSDEMFVAITPCAVVSNGSDDSVEKMLARAQDIWLRGVRTGAVHSGH